MVYVRAVPRGAAMDYARRPRSRVAPHRRRMLWRRNLSAGGGWLPAGGMGGAQLLAQRSGSLFRASAFAPVVPTNDVWIWLSIGRAPWSAYSTAVFRRWDQPAGEALDLDGVEANQSHVAQRPRQLPRVIELETAVRQHGGAGIEQQAHRHARLHLE